MHGVKFLVITAAVAVPVAVAIGFASRTTMDPAAPRAKWMYRAMPAIAGGPPYEAWIAPADKIGAAEKVGTFTEKAAAIKAAIDMIESRGGEPIEWVAESGPPPKETAAMPQGNGSYVGDPKGFTTWPGQDVLPTQRAIGEALADLGYPTGSWNASNYSVLTSPTFESVGKFQADWNLYKKHYQGAWASELGKVDGLLGKETMRALAGVVENRIDWIGALEEIRSSTPDTPPPPKPSTGGSHKQKLWSMLRALPELTEDQRLFIMLVAYGETGGTFRATAHNDLPSEVLASVKAWDNNPTLAAKLVNCGAGGRDSWAIGSGGYGGRLGPYFGNDMLRARLECNPELLFDPIHSLISALVTAHYIQKGPHWKASAKTVKNLRAGYYGLAYIKNPPADRIEKYRKHAQAVGMSPDFVDVKLTDFPSPAAARNMVARLKNVA